MSFGLDTIRRGAAAVLPLAGSAVGGGLGAWTGGKGGFSSGVAGGGLLGQAAADFIRPSSPGPMQGTQDALVGQVMEPYSGQLRQELSHGTQYSGEAPEMQAARQYFLDQTLMQPSTPASFLGDRVGPMLSGIGRFVGEQAAPYLRMDPVALGGPGEFAGGILQDYLRGKTQQPGQMADIRQKLFRDLALSASGASEYDPTSFEPIRERAMKDFRGRVAPGIVEAGAVGGSSATTLQLSTAEKDLLSQLAALEEEHRERFLQRSTTSEERRRDQLLNLLAGQQQVGISGLGILSKEDLARRELQQGGLRNLVDFELKRRGISGDMFGKISEEERAQARADLERKGQQGDMLIKLARGKSGDIKDLLGGIYDIARSGGAKLFGYKDHAREEGLIEAALTKLLDVIPGVAGIAARGKFNSDPAWKQELFNKVRELQAENKAAAKKAKVT